VVEEVASSMIDALAAPIEAARSTYTKSH
jgi:hypothetical protein